MQYTNESTNTNRTKQTNTNNNKQKYEINNYIWTTDEQEKQKFLKNALKRTQTNKQTNTFLKTV